MKIDGFQIGTPIIKSDISRIILGVSGVTSINNIVIENLTSTVNEKVYSEFSYSIKNNTYNEIIYPPEGGIFQLKYPCFN